MDQSSNLLNSSEAAATVAKAAVTATSDAGDATKGSSTAVGGITALLAKRNMQQHTSIADSTSLPAARWQLLRKCFSRRKACEGHGSQQSHQQQQQEQQQQQLQDQGRQLLSAQPSHVRSNAAATVGSFQLACGGGCNSSSQHPNQQPNQSVVTPGSFTPSTHTSPINSDSTLSQLSVTPCTADHSSSAWLQKETAEEAAANWAWRQSLKRAQCLLMFEELVEE